MLHQRRRNHGGTYLELSINESSQPALPHLEFKPQPGVSYIPSRPSHIGNAIQNISRMLDELEKVNFIQLADKLNQTLDNMNDILNQSELRSTLKSVNNICSTLENTVSRAADGALRRECGKAEPFDRQHRHQRAEPEAYRLQRRTFRDRQEPESVPDRRAAGC